jgi:hypothetical protein
VKFIEKRGDVEMKLNNETTCIYTDDGYGGVVQLELDWNQDVTWERGELNDGFDSIVDCFENRTSKWYSSIFDWFHEMDEFTEIE